MWSCRLRRAVSGGWGDGGLRQLLVPALVRGRGCVYTSGYQRVGWIGWLPRLDLWRNGCAEAEGGRGREETEDGRDSERRARRQVAGEVVVGRCRFDVKTALDWKDKATSESPQSPARRRGRGRGRISSCFPRPPFWGSGASKTRVTEISVPQFWLRLQYAAFSQRSEQGRWSSSFVKSSLRIESPTYFFIR